MLPNVIHAETIRRSGYGFWLGGALAATIALIALIALGAADGRHSPSARSPRVELHSHTCGEAHASRLERARARHERRISHQIERARARADREAARAIREAAREARHAQREIEREIERTARPSHSTRIYFSR